MNNFGVIELASTKTTNAPGWAYVPDHAPHHATIAAASTTSNRKRSRAAASGGAGAQLSLADANAREATKARREIEILDRDNARDVHIGIPAKPGANNRTATAKKYTPNVRRILQSQKTFTNHLDDYIALTAQQEANPSASASASATPAAAAVVAAEGGGTERRGSAAESSATTASSRRAGGGHRHAPSTASNKKSNNKHDAKDSTTDIEMRDAPPLQTTDDQPQAPRSAILTPYTLPPTHPEDTNPLLASRLPTLPSDDELRALLSAAPLSYLEARGTWPWPPASSSTGESQGQQQQYPTRVFCAVCGYWGRVRCMKCGTRVCALECLETHREECITRYGL
ncbi:hypothetical protein F4777DRAFT_513991 [Nemania sp. FL0916]|nr:hypothetical protein F4777DRAFT_513991 [Nemania sp. FL0916]